MRIVKPLLSAHRRSEEAIGEELTPDQLEEVRGGENQNHVDEVLGLSQPVPRDSQYYGAWSDGRQLALDGTNMTAAGTTTLWAGTYAGNPWVMGGGALTAFVGTEKVEEGVLQMKDAEARYDAYRAEQMRQLEEAEARELKELEEAKERQDAEDREIDRLLEESDQMLREAGYPTTAQGGPPANAETYSGELPSFPSYMVNADSREAEISTEQVGPTTIGYGYSDSTQQESRPGRLY